MNSVMWIVRRELGVYFKSPIGYIIIAAVLVLQGFFFNAAAIGSGARKSSEVLETFFLYASGCSLVGAVFISMRLIAEDRQTGAFVLLATSPMRDWQIVLGKYLSALAFFTVMIAASAYMPALVLINGKVSFGHIAAGYFGMFLVGGASLALGLLFSALAPNQLVAAISTGAVTGVFVLFWLLSRIASPPIDDVIAYLSIYDKHFRPFMRGLISIQDVVFYVALAFVALVMTTRVLEARRWR